MNLRDTGVDQGSAQLRNLEVIEMDGERLGCDRTHQIGDPVRGRQDAEIAINLLDSPAVLREHCADRLSREYGCMLDGVRVLYRLGITYDGIRSADLDALMQTIEIRDP